jgi:uncharacterized protein (TIGR02588 family)
MTAPSDERQDGDERATSESDPAPQALTTLEKIATAVSALLVGFLLVVLIRDAIQPNTSPSFVTRARKVEIRNGAYRAEVSVENTGDDAAKSVVVHMELTGKDSALAETDVTIDWLPGRTTHDVVGFFPRPAGVPAEDIRGVKAEVHGYAAP